MTRRATLIATLTASPSEEGSELVSLRPEVEWLEVRADLVGDLDPEWLRNRFAGKILYTLRSEEEGGTFEGSNEIRHARLVKAASGYDRVDLEADRDLGRDLLEAIPARQRIISWHGPATGVDELKTRLKAMTEAEAVLYKLVPAARESGQELAPLELLSAVDRPEVVAFSSGEVGVWTRLVAPYLGAPVVYGSLGTVAGAPGQPTVERLMRDFGLPDLPTVDAYRGIVGRPVSHSLSPRLHNGAYRALGLKSYYLPFHAEHFADFWLEVVEGSFFSSTARPLAGLSVTAPYKKPALSVAGASSPLAEQIDGANTLVKRDGVWEAESTDPEGVLGPLAEHRVETVGRSAAVVGCGGAGRAAAAGLARAGAEVTLVNRGAERGRRVAESLGLPFVPLSDFVPASYDLVIHATPLGHSPQDVLPFDVGDLRPGAAVVDLVYGEAQTPLIRQVRETGRIGIDGREVLLHQALGQFRLMTGHELPRELGRELLDLEAPA